MAKSVIPNEAEEVSPVIIGYKFALGVIEILLGIGIIALDGKVFEIYKILGSFEFFDGPNDALARLLGSLIPYIFQHRIAIILILFFIGAVKIISCIAIWMEKNWGVHLLLLLMLVLLPFDLFDLLRNLLGSQSGAGSIALNAINIWIILSLTHYHPVEYLKKLDFKHLFS